MSAEQAEAAFGQLWQAHMSQYGQPEGAYKLMDSFFGFIRKTGMFNDPAAVQKVQDIATKHVGLSKKEFEKKNASEAKKEAEHMAASTKRAEEVSIKKLKEENARKAKVAEDKAAKTASDAAKAAKKAASEGKEGDEGDEGDAEDEKEDSGPAPEGNGGRTNAFVWTQTLQEINVIISIPEGTRAKGLAVDIDMDTLSVVIKGGASLVDGQFNAIVDSEEATWTLEDDKELGRQLVLYLPKRDKMSWWPCVLKGDPEIDTKKIVPENSKLEDLDGDVRGTVEKMMFDQRQKKMGLPTSDESKKQDQLAKFMAAHPEMDFSQAKIN